MAVEVGGDVAPRAAVLGGAVRGELGMVMRDAREARGLSGAPRGSLFGPRFPPQSHVPEWRRQVAQTYQAGEEVVS